MNIRVPPTANPNLDNNETRVYTPIVMDEGFDTGFLMEGAAHCVVYSLRKATRAVSQLYDRMLRPSGLRVTQFSLLVELAIASSTTISELADKMVMDRTTLTRNLKPLEKRGLAVIVPGQDRRTRVASLTRQGAEVLMQALPLWIEAQAQILGELDEEEWENLRQALSKIVDAATR
jgi:DNA-binding MarR family transcriptional regulator